MEKNTYNYEEQVKELETLFENKKKFKGSSQPIAQFLSTSGWMLKGLDCYLGGLYDIDALKAFGKKLIANGYFPYWVISNKGSKLSLSVYVTSQSYYNIISL